MAEPSGLNNLNRAQEKLVMEYHEAANIFPLDEEHLDDLARDISENGLIVPIKTLDGKIVDGRRRWLACGKAHIEPTLEEVSPEDPVAYVLSLNLHRRHLNISQRAMVAARSIKVYEKQAKERQRQHGNTAPGKQQNTSHHPVLSVPVGKSVANAGKAVGVGGTSVERARRVQEQGIPEVVQAVDAGDLSVNRADTIVSLPKRDQSEVLQESLDPPPQEARTIKSRGVGVSLANEAINCLTRIPRTDHLRKRGFEIVSDWIGHNP